MAGGTKIRNKYRTITMKTISLIMIYVLLGLSIACMYTNYFTLLFINIIVLIGWAIIFIGEANKTKIK